MKPPTSDTHDSPVTAHSFPVIREHIVSTPDTCGGKPRVAGSRICVKDIVIWHVHQGMSPDQIIAKWPHLTLTAVHAALAHYDDCKEEIDREIEADEAAYEEMKAKTPSLVQGKLAKLGAVNASDDPLPS
jgi:uncharacterized protein (DUF433 family)